MIEVFGPRYRYSGERLTKPEVIYVIDHHYDEEEQRFHFLDLLANSDCDPKEHVIVFDHVNHDDEFPDLHTVCLPMFLAAECQEFKNDHIHPIWTNKTSTFNFMINKPRPNREFLLLLLGYYGLHTNTYSLPWKDADIDRNTLKKYTTNKLYHEIIDTKLVFNTQTYKFGEEIAMDRGIRNGNYKNAETYNGLLKNSVFEPSCISLITEPVFFERETIHTEKTLMSLLGGTLPIWVGGWRLPEFMERMRFDIFSDIIDHSYQNLADPFDRCHEAIVRNLDLLKDFERTKNIVQSLDTRFKNNMDHLLTNPFFELCMTTILKQQEPIKNQLASIIPQFKDGVLYRTFRHRADYQLLGHGPWKL